MIMSNKKNKTTPQGGADQYLTDFVLRNDTFFCPWYGVYVEHSRKTTIEYHINSQSHKKK